MLHSMTGFGRAEAALQGYTLTAEIRSLNGKGFDLSLRLPSALRSREPQIRNLVSQKLGRGTIDLGITLKIGGSSRPMRINTELAAHYYSGIQEVAEKLSLNPQNILQTLLQMPEVVAAENESLPEEILEAVMHTVSEAADALTEHRKAEGAVLDADLRERMAAIAAAREAIVPLEAGRIEKVKEKLRAALEEHVGTDKIDANRFEQELIFYLEKLDFSEEKIRLDQHIAYFLELLEEADASKGKKLGFVLQEVGREINTMGSKASDAAIQKKVVVMKDELEKAKEQVLNVL